MYYYGARYYDPRISIFVSLDPLVEQTFEPYSYTGNNPINFTDPTGMSIDKIETHFVNEKGETIANTDDGSNEVFVIRKNEEKNFVENLTKNVKNGDDLDVLENEKLGKKYGYNIKDIKEKGGKPNFPKGDTKNDGMW